MKATLAKDLVIGKIYSDIKPSSPNATFFEYVGLSEKKRLVFKHLAGPIGAYRTEYGKNYHFRDVTEGYPDTELSPSEIEQYLPTPPKG